MIKSSPLSLLALGLPVLGLISLAACQQSGPSGADEGSVWEDVTPLISMEEGPSYHLLDGYGEKWFEQVKQGVELSRSYWGSYGPAHVWILGCEDGESISEAAKEAFLSEYCAWRTASSERSVSECLPYAEERFFDVAERGDPEAYLSDVRDTEPRMAELIFINVHKWYREEESFPDPILRGIHEYTHVFQQGFGQMPTWMMEGGAVFSEVWLPFQEGLIDPHEKMRWIMQSAHKVESSGYTIADMEEIESAPKRIAKYHRELAYDSGAWAMVFMIHTSPTQSVTAL
ncbi:MAG: hypothetical protein OSB14_07525, partial [Planctomycetota bacterium]|nr:hypothetical protein [Planctomycetota bacterium]